MKNKEKIRASFSVAPQTAKLAAMARDKALMKVEKSLNFWVEKKRFLFLVCSALMEKHVFCCSAIP